MFMYVLVLISLSAYVHAEPGPSDTYLPPSFGRKAVAVLTVGTANGTIYFSDIGRGILITGSVSGLTPGNHGFHIHDKGDLSNGCTSTGSHFNPHHMNHGAPIDSVRHVGDLGNIIADQQGVAQINFSDKVIHLEGVNNILGRAVVVHADADDLGKGGHEDSLTTGHAGARVGCGVIGIVNESNSGDNQKVLSLATVFTSGLFLIIRNFVH